MLKAVRGIYRNGQIYLLEMPEDIGEAEVIVTFLPGSITPVEKLVREKREEILKLAAHYGAEDVRFLQSLTIGGGRPINEVDFLVRLEPGRDAFDLGGLMEDLRELLGREVHITTDSGLEERIRDRVLEEAVSV